MSILISQYISVQLDLTTMPTDELTKLQLRLASEQVRRVNKNPDELDEAEKHLAVTQGKLTALNAYKARVENLKGVKDAVQLIDDYIRSLSIPSILTPAADKPPVPSAQVVQKPVAPATAESDAIPTPEKKVVEVSPPTATEVVEKKPK